MSFPLLDRLRELVLENVGLKLLSFAFALGMYAFIHGSQDAQRTLLLDVVAIPPPDGAHRVLMTQLPQIRATVRGSRALLDDLRSDEVGPVNADLRNGRTERLVLDPKAVPVPPGVWVEQVDPAVVDLKWEDEVDVDVPIQAAITGQPAPGFVVGTAPRVEPATVRARGPRSLVETLQHARLDAFDVSGLSREGTFERTLSIDRPPPRVKFAIDTAVARVEIGRELIERQFVRIPVQIVGAARAVARPVDVDVKVKGPPEIVRALRTEQVVPVIDLARAGVALGVPGSALAEPKVELDRCTAEIVPARVTVRW